MRTARTSISLVLLAAAVTAVSLVNQLVIARSFGAAAALDGYLQATSIPSLVAGAVGGVFAYAMLPALARAASDPQHLSRVAGAFLLSFVVLGVLLAIAGWMLSPTIIRVLSRGAPPTSFADAIAISRVAWLSAACGVGVGFWTALLNVHGRFVLPALLSSFPYVGGIVAVLIGHRALGTMSLAVGMLAGTASALLMLAVTTRGAVRTSGLSAEDFEPVQRFARAFPVVLLSVMAFLVFQSIDAYWAPQLGASNLSVLGYSQRLLIALGGVIATGPSMILQRRLATAATAGDERAFLDDLGRGLKLTMLTAAPVALWVSSVAAPLVRVAFERGAFDRAVTLSLAGLVPYMLFGMVPMLCAVMLFKGLYAKADLRMAALMGVAGPLLYFFGSALLIGRGLPGLGAAYAITWCVLALAGVLYFWRQVALTPGMRRFLRDLGLLLAVTAAAAAASAWLLRSWESDVPLALLAKLAVTAAGTTASYLYVGLFVARVADLRVLVGSVMRLPPSTR